MLINFHVFYGWCMIYAVHAARFLKSRGNSLEVWVLIRWNLLVCLAIFEALEGISDSKHCFLTKPVFLAIQPSVTESLQVIPSPSCYKVTCWMACQSSIQLFWKISLRSKSFHTFHQFDLRKISEDPVFPENPVTTVTSHHTRFLVLQSTFRSDWKLGQKLLGLWLPVEGPNVC